MELDNAEEEQNKNKMSKAKRMVMLLTSHSFNFNEKKYANAIFIRQIFLYVRMKLIKPDRRS